MKRTIFPSVEEALLLHKTLIIKFGGIEGVRDMGLLESALARPKSGYYTSITEQAAALFQSLLMNHCFIDGNKRVAFALMAIFLKINGYSIKVNQKEAYDFIIKEVIEAKADISKISLWIKEKIVM